MTNKQDLDSSDKVPTDCGSSNSQHRVKTTRPQEALEVWCPGKWPKSPSNAQIFGPQIHKFGHTQPRDVLK